MRDKSKDAEAHEWKKNAIFDDGCGEKSDSDDFEEKQRARKRNTKGRQRKTTKKKNGFDDENVDIVVKLLFTFISVYALAMPQTVILPWALECVYIDSAP